MHFDYPLVGEVYDILYGVTDIIAYMSQMLQAITSENCYEILGIK